MSSPKGRDQGTLVFPDAFRKYYLTASDEERALRRVGEFRARGESVSFESVLRDQRERDARDAARAIAPMKPAPDAVVIDTTGLSVEAVVDRMARDIEGAPGSDAIRLSQPRASSPHDGAQTVAPRNLPPRSLGAIDYCGTMPYGILAILATVLMRWRATGQGNVPATGGALARRPTMSVFSTWFFWEFPLRRPLNYVARSTLFVLDPGPVHSFGGSISDSAGGNGGLGHERNAAAASRAAGS